MNPTGLNITWNQPHNQQVNAHHTKPKVAKGTPYQQPQAEKSQEDHEGTKGHAKDSLAEETNKAKRPLGNNHQCPKTGCWLQRMVTRRKTGRKKASPGTQTTWSPKEGSEEKWKAQASSNPGTQATHTGKAKSNSVHGLWPTKAKAIEIKATKPEKQLARNPNRCRLLGRDAHPKRRCLSD